MNVARLERYIPILPLCAAVLYLGYGPTRADSLPLLAGYFIAFAAYAWTVSKIQMEWRQLIWIAVGVRVLLFLTPITWTDDHFRYIWDGLCTTNGISPFAYTPETLLSEQFDAFTGDHFALLNSPKFHSVYPPVAQTVFAMAAWVGQGDLWISSLVLRAVSIGSDIAAILVLGHLLLRDPRRVQLVAHYALNPLVLMEFTVNLHTEVLVIAPSLLAALLLQRERFVESASMLAVAMAAKLWPILFLVWLPSRIGLERTFVYVLITLGLFLASWIPFWTPDMVPNIISSLRLYYEHLEFNGPLFEGLRWLVGDGPVKGTGMLAGITLVGIATYGQLIRKNKGTPWTTAMLWLLAIHLLGSQSLHPWYVLPLVAFAVLTSFRWPILWTLLIVPTYLTYGEEPYHQPYWYIALEYVLLIAYMVWEIGFRSKPAHATTASDLPARS
jgi:hypothetical protein